MKEVEKFIECQDCGVLLKIAYEKHIRGVWKRVSEMPEHKQCIDRGMLALPSDKEVREHHGHILALRIEEY